MPENLYFLVKLNTETLKWVEFVSISIIGKKSNKKEMKKIIKT